MSLRPWLEAYSASSYIMTNYAWLASLVAGYSLSAVLYGVLSLQVSTYLRNSSKDSAWLKSMITGLYVLESVMFIFDASQILSYSRASDPFNRSALNRMMCGNTVMTAIISTIVQLFQAKRVFCLSGKWFMHIVAGFLALCSLATGMAIGIRQIPRLELGELSSMARPHFPDGPALILSWLTLSATTDVILAVSLTLCLYQCKGSLFERTNAIINRLIYVTIGTGIITATCSILDAVFHTTHNPISFFFIPDFALSKLYVNSVLVSLNTREISSNILDQSVPNSFTVSEHVRNPTFDVEPILRPPLSDSSHMS